jgi:hypothetical protein
MTCNRNRSLLDFLVYEENFVFFFYQCVVIYIYSNLKSFESLRQTFLIERFKFLTLFSLVRLRSRLSGINPPDPQENSLLNKRNAIIGRKAL